MEFKDYYAILGIGRQSSADEIRAAYRLQSKKWHPDLNPGKDVTQMMQDINEAYAILKDPDKKVRYDHEYDTYYRAERDTHKASYAAETIHEEEWQREYDVHDEHLREDINEARRYAEDLVAEFFKSLKKTSVVAAKGAWDEAKGYLISGIIISIIATMILTCSH